MAGNSPTSPLPGVTRGGKAPTPLGSLNSITIHSPLGSLGSVNGGIFNSGHFKATPAGQRRRWCDYTPTEVWPATPSPAGHDGMCSFGVPGPGPLTQPMPMPMPAPASAPAPMQQVATSPAGSPVTYASPQMHPQMPVTMQVPMQQMPMQGGAQQNLPEGAQMVFMQMPAAQSAHGFFPMPVAQQPGQVVFMAPAPAPAPRAQAPAPVPAPSSPVPAEQPVDAGPVSDAALQHAAGRQLFNEAMDPSTFEGHTPNLASKGSALHGTGRCSPCAWFWKARGCNSGFDCTYCHMCPEGELKSRKKAKVQAIRMGVLEPAGKAGANAQTHNRGALKLNQLI
ncbi:unnamed protein product [Effrenium voratum]|nr:unnamed protein product [Effrenium voratum]